MIQPLHDNVLTITWAEGFDRFNKAVTSLEKKATSSASADSLREELRKNGLLVAGAFDHLGGLASAVDIYHYNHEKITDTELDDFGFAVGRSSVHVVAKGNITSKCITVSEIGIYLKDPYRFDEGNDDQRLGVWDFKEMTFEGYFEMFLSEGEYIVRNRHFMSYQTAKNKGADYTSTSRRKKAIFC